MSLHRRQLYSIFTIVAAIFLSTLHFLLLLLFFGNSFCFPFRFMTWCKHKRFGKSETRANKKFRRERKTNFPSKQIISHLGHTFFPFVLAVYLFRFCVLLFSYFASAAAVCVVRIFEIVLQRFRFQRDRNWNSNYTLEFVPLWLKCMEKLHSSFVLHRRHFQL